MLPKDYRPGDVLNLPTELGTNDGFVPDAGLRAQTQVRFRPFNSLFSPLSNAPVLTIFVLYIGVTAGIYAVDGRC